MQSSETFPSLAGAVSDAEWQARTDLAMAHRIAAYHGWAQHIFNHISMRVPDEPDHFLIKRHDQLFDEITASSLIKIDMSGKPVGLDENVNPAGFNIHAAMLKARPDFNCVIHIHTTDGQAVGAYPEGLLPLTQSAMRFYRRIGYHDYEGIAEKPGEQERLAKNIGPHNALILRNHGLLVGSHCVSDAIYRMYQLVSSCEVQVKTLSMGAKPHLPPHEVCEETAQQWIEFERRADERDSHNAYMRIAERLDPSFKT